MALQETQKNEFITTQQKQTLVKDYLRKEFLNSIRTSTDNIAPFIKGDLVYGKGIRNISRGYISPTDFTDTDPKRVPNPSVPKLYTEDLTDEFKLVFTNTISEEDYLSSFASAEELSNFIKQLSGRLEQSYKLNLEQSIGFIFDEKVEEGLLTLTPKQKEELQKIKTKLEVAKENLTVKALDAESIEQAIRLKAFELTRFKKTNSGLKTIPASCPINEQILVLSNTLFEKIKAARKGQFNPTDLFSEFYKVIVLDSDENTIFLLDKEALRLYPRINKVLTQEYNARMETDYYLHFWLTVGIYQSFVVKKLTIIKG